MFLMRRKTIGLSANINNDNPIADYANVAYCSAVIKASGTPLILPVTKNDDVLNDYIDICDGFIFTGGKDITPLFYGEETRPLCSNTSTNLDEYQIALFKRAFATQKPILGICRGMQLMNVVLGGTLYQDLSEHDQKVLKHVQSCDPLDTAHEVHFENGSVLFDIFGEKAMVNSTHHQAIKMPGKDLMISARAYDGIIEAVEHRDHPFCVGVQWHPEKLADVDEKMFSIFKIFMDKVNDL